MNKLKLGLLGLYLLIAGSCMEHDLNSLSSEVNMEVGLAIPLIHSTTTLGDLLPDNESISTDDEGFISISFRQDSIAQVLSDSLLVLENSAPTEESFTVGEINLPDFSTNRSVVMTELLSNLENAALSAQINEAITISQSFGSAYFPPIAEQTGGEYNAHVSEQFQSMFISEGLLSISITNNLAVDLSVLVLRLSNSIDNTILGQFEFSNIIAGSSESATLALDGLILYSNIKMEILNLASDGTGLDPLDQSQWVPISHEDELSVVIEGLGIVARYGSVKIPAQTGPDSTFAVSLDFESDVEVDFIDLAAGQFVYSFESDLNTTLQLNLEIPQLLDENNNPFSEDIQIVNSGLVVNSISLEGYKFDFSSNVNQLQVNYSSQILESQNFVSYNHSDEISLSIGMEDLEFNLIQGYFGQIEEYIAEDVLDIDFSALSDIASGIILETPSLIFTADNSIGIPFEINFELLGENQGEYVELGGPVFEIPSEQESSVVFDSENSQLSEFVALNPTTINYSGSVLSNPLGNTGVPNTIRPNTNITLGFEMDLPLHLRIKDANTLDTLDLSFEFENPVEMIESVTMKLHTQNEFPLDVELTMFFQDSITGLLVDSLNVGLLQAAEVDEYGRVVEPKVYNSNISVSSAQLEALLNSNKTILDIRMNSYDSDNSAVKLYTDYEFIIDAGLLVELKIEE